MRNAFIDELLIQARLNSNIVLIVGDLGYSVVEPFADEFPDRFINAGVAEQNMIGVAAGLASEGYHVFTYSIANFPTFRCAEQIRNDVDYHNLPVTTVVVGGGLAYGNLGYSHHAVQDYALMRSMPNILIAAPGDPMEVRSCLRYLVQYPGPSYLRLGKAGELNFHQKPPNIYPGSWVKIRNGTSQRIILCTGAILQMTNNMLLTSDYEDCSVFSLPLWSMLDKNKQAKQVEKYSEVITLEDHLFDGGFGSWMLESLPANTGLRDKITVRALDPKVCGLVGSQAFLHKAGGLPAV